MKVLIIGGHGQIGKALCALMQKRGIHFIAPDRVHLELTQEQQVAQCLTTQNIDLVVNTTSYTPPENAERDPTAAYELHHKAVANLAYHCQQRSIILLHLSNWQVFDGLKSSPYTEEDASNPKGVLGNNCWHGEEKIRKRLPNHIILRLSWLISQDLQGYANQLLTTLKAGSPWAVAKDYFGCPTLASDIARVIVGIILQIGYSASSFGTYHYASVEPVSEPDFALMLVKEANRYGQYDANLLKVGNCDTVHGSCISCNATLDGHKILNTFGIHPRAWRAEIPSIIKALHKNL